MESSRSLRSYLLVMLRGVAMGAADVVPGVSGGTVAFITGIYEELIDSLRRIDHSAINCLFRQGPIAAWRHINGNFLLALFSGILLSILSLAKVITFCLHAYPIIVWSFFFGLVLASALYMAGKVNWKNWRVPVALLLGAAIALLIAVARPAELPSDWWVIALSGALAICAMILPGISGSFILVLLGIYNVILQALVELNVTLLASFVLGCVIGLLLFSHVLAWLLHRFHDITVSLLIGFMFGSLSIIWPWKQVLITTLNRHGEQIPVVQKNILPTTYESLLGADPHLFGAVCALMAGLVLVLVVELWGRSGAKNCEADQ